MTCSWQKEAINLKLKTEYECKWFSDLSLVSMIRNFLFFGGGRGMVGRGRGRYQVIGSKTQFSIECHTTL